MRARTVRRTGAVAVAAAAGLAVRTAGERFRRFEVAESSMIPALQAGDYVISRRLSRPVERGDIVVFEQRPSYFLVKRVVGRPGETVAIHDGEVLIDGYPLEEPWTVEDTAPAGTWELTSGEVFLLGDARELSADDSRHIGPVPVHALTWRVIFRYWPVRRFGPVR